MTQILYRIWLKTHPIDANNRSIANVKITINDLNDNIPVFEKSTYYACVNAMANINDVVTNVTAIDQDFGANGSITYYIKASNLYKFGSNRSSGSIIPSPFNISDRGEICTATYLAENNQHRFVIDVIARENAFPERGICKSLRKVAANTKCSRSNYLFISGLDF